ncbi:mannose-6-phosphate isomerase, type 1 [Lutibacter agarilyticus]|uniref:Phosphohexomutase n=1 Tax=Lutibacter agarilyticus TaxID=1109740 RepID=A0A238WQ91_9FLAO|nr:type I phosphomannose isomerase catalytic subunit [Lutibacter agarilyticus]SNR48561.1 mannose-6-phosphate isomerase, type 1 [Lutibacter agarilyticus]
MNLYPLKFQPISKYRIWGGEKIKTILNKDFNENNIGETWEISGVNGDETVVSEGPLKGQTLKNIIETYKEHFVGNNTYKHFGNEFPLLIKFIDAKLPLSIQVHPNDVLAKQRHNSFGKNEMWYIMEADESAEIIVGFNKECSKKEFQHKLENAEVLDIMNAVKVSEGDTFYIPAGRIHAIGSGVLLAEIQQTSDVTYRVYDYNRVDAKTGEKRELHVDLALDVIDYGFHKEYKTSYKQIKNESNKLVHSPYFNTNFIEITTEITKDYTLLDSFVIYICVDGHFEISCNNTTYTVSKGETILLPAAIQKVILSAEFAKLLEVYI